MRFASETGATPFFVIKPRGNLRVRVGAMLCEICTIGVTTVNIETLSGEQITLSVLLVPMIAAPLQNTYHTHLLSMKHLHGLQLANPVTKDSKFEISLLIGADYYW